MARWSGISQFQLTDNVAIVTGGSKGLGEAMAAGLASAGANLLLVSRNEDEAKAAAVKDQNLRHRAFSLCVMNS